MGFLDKVTRGKVVEPVSIIVYGVDGVGKTKFGAEAPDPIFLGAEQGTSELDVTRLPAPQSFKDCTEMIKEMIADQTFTHKSLVIDTLDWLEPLIWKHVCLIHPKKPKLISEIGYQKGYETAITVAREFMALLDQLRLTKGVNVILLAHGKVRTFQDPTTTSGYDRYQLAMRDDMASVWRQFVKAVLFINYDTVKADDDDRRAFGEGGRVMYTEERPSFQAKNRYDLPFKIIMKKDHMWEEFYKAVEKGRQPSTAASLSIDIAQLIKEIPSAYLDANPGVMDKINGFVKDAGFEVQKLSDIKNRLKAIIGGVA